MYAPALRGALLTALNGLGYSVDFFPNAGVEAYVVDPARINDAQTDGSGNPLVFWKLEVSYADASLARGAVELLSDTAAFRTLVETGLIPCDALYFRMERPNGVRVAQNGNDMIRAYNCWRP